MSEYSLYQYNDNDFRLVCNKYSKNNFDKPIMFCKSSQDEILRSEISRAKRLIREYALCNEFEYFTTLTINSKNSDRYSLAECQENLRKCLKAMKRKNKEFAYVFITEKHKDGAFHFHGLTKNVPDLYINEYGYYSSNLFDNKLGFCSFSPIRDYSKTCNYITKYITKDCIKNDRGTIYINSRGLKRAIVSKISPIDFSQLTNKKSYYENDFCVIQDFRLSDLSRKKLLYLYFLQNTIYFKG